MLAFDHAEHRYTWNGAIVPSVTQVLAPLFDWSRVPPAILERKRQIGQAVHEAIEYDLRGTLIESSIDPACRGYFNGFRLFCRECKFEPVLVEYRVYNKRHRYAGTLDTWGLLNSAQALIDWKNSAVMEHDAVGAQTYAYLAALVEAGIASINDKRFALQLRPDGTYKLHRYRQLAYDAHTFLMHRGKHAIR